MKSLDQVSIHHCKTVYIGVRMRELLIVYMVLTRYMLHIQQNSTQLREVFNNNVRKQFSQVETSLAHTHTHTPPPPPFKVEEEKYHYFSGKQIP